MPGLETRRTNFPLDSSGTTALKHHCGREKQASQHALLSLASPLSVILKSLGTGELPSLPPDLDIYKVVNGETTNLLTTVVDKNEN